MTAAQVPQGWPLSGGLTVVYFAPLISCALHPSLPPPPPFGQAVVLNIVPRNNFVWPSTSCLFLLISLIKFSQYLADVEEHLGETISVIQPNMKVSVNEFDGKVQYGEKRRRVGKDWVLRHQPLFLNSVFPCCYIFLNI